MNTQYSDGIYQNYLELYRKYLGSVTLGAATPSTPMEAIPKYLGMYRNYLGSVTVGAEMPMGSIGINWGSIGMIWDPQLGGQECPVLQWDLLELPGDLWELSGNRNLRGGNAQYSNGIYRNYLGFYINYLGYVTWGAGCPVLQ